jgi:hypothetical protein
MTSRQVPYEEYSQRRGLPPEWDDVSYENQAIWENVASAVVSWCTRAGTANPWSLKTYLLA